MSTLHKDAAVSSGSDKKPTIILDYNKNKGGVDNLDKLTATYTCQRMTRRWPMVVFYNILDASACNAFVLWTHIHQGWNSTKKTNGECFLRSWEIPLSSHTLSKGNGCPETQMLQPWSDSCSAHLELRPHQHPPQPALPQHHPQQPQPQPQPHSGHLTLKERGVRSAQAVRTERQMYCASTATNISAKNTLKVSLFATHAHARSCTQRLLR